MSHPSPNAPASSRELAEREQRMEQAWRNGGYFDPARDEPPGDCPLAASMTAPAFDPEDRCYLEEIIVGPWRPRSALERALSPVFRLLGRKEVDRWLTRLTRAEFESISRVGRSLALRGPHLDADPASFAPGVLSRVGHLLYHLSERDETVLEGRLESNLRAQGRILVYLRADRG